MQVTPQRKTTIGSLACGLMHVVKGCTTMTPRPPEGEKGGGGKTGRDDTM